MNILSNWKLTYDPAGTLAVLLDYHMELTDEPEMSLRRGLEVVTIPYGTPFLRPTKSDIYEVAISIMRRSSTDAFARRDMINQFVDRYDQTTRVPIRLEALNLTDRYYQWSAAFIHSASVKRVVAEGEDGAAGWLLKFGFTAVGLTKTIL
jgi:hypothetical protein